MAADSGEKAWNTATFTCQVRTVEVRVQNEKFRAGVAQAGRLR